jgi:hypothetical protein
MTPNQLGGFPSSKLVAPFSKKHIPQTLTLVAAQLTEDRRRHGNLKPMMSRQERYVPF